MLPPACLLLLDDLYCLWPPFLMKLIVDSLASSDFSRTLTLVGPAGLVALLTAFGRTASGIVSERPSCLRQHPGRNSTPSPSPWTREYYLNVSHYNASTARSEKTPIGRCASSASWPSWARVPYPWLEWRNPEKTSSPLN